MSNLDFLLGGPELVAQKTTVHPEANYRKATVTGVNPLMIQLDGDTAAMDISPDVLTNANISRAGERVLVLVLGRQMIVTGVLGTGAVTGSLEPVGAVTLFSSPLVTPSKYLPADGRSLLRADYPALFSVIGTNYGAADVDHFSLPTLANVGALPYIIRVLA